jgi:hypothetical protein
MAALEAVIATGRMPAADQGRCRQGVRQREGRGRRGRPREILDAVAEPSGSGSACGRGQVSERAGAKGGVGSMPFSVELDGQIGSE